MEGGNVNSDTWLLEHLPGTIFSEPSGDAVDHYHRFAADIALIASLGFTSYRFSIEWARIEPEPGEFSTAALDHYRRVLEACHAARADSGRHLSPLHLAALAARRGWLGGLGARRRSSPATATSSPVHLGDLIGVACTLNEPNLPYLLKAFGIGGEDPANRANIPLWAPPRLLSTSTPPPWRRSSSAPPRRATRSRLAAHRAGRDAIKAVRPELAVGWTLANSDIQAGPGGTAIADRVRREVNERFLEASRGDDFVGIQTYGRTVFGADGLLPAPQGVEANQMGEEVFPQGLEATIREAWRIAGIPVIVTENGLATEDDTQRLAYLEIAVAGSRPASPTASTSAATSPGPRSTTSSGSSATGPSSG